MKNSSTRAVLDSCNSNISKHPYKDLKTEDDYDEYAQVPAHPACQTWYVDDNHDFDDDGDYNNPALGLLPSDSALAVGKGKTFRRVSQNFFYENGHRLGMKSRKFVPRMENEPPLQGLQMGR